MVTFQGHLILNGHRETLQEIRGHVDAKDEWVYVQQRGDGVRVWTGPACSECSVELLSVRRCELHRDLVLVAVQLELL